MRRPLKTFLTWTAIVGGIAFIAIQFVPVRRANPPIELDLPAPDAVKEILRRACYDCHSHETHWPWYSRVAPVSWLVTSDVRVARGDLNFSTWNRYDAAEQAHLIEECWEEVDSDAMPLWIYRPLHPRAWLTEEDRGVLREWAESAGGRGR